MNADTTIVLVPVLCANPFCWAVVKMGKPQIVGELSPGSVARLRCPKCRECRIYRARGHSQPMDIP